MGFDMDMSRRYLANRTYLQRLPSNRQDKGTVPGRVPETKPEPEEIVARQFHST